MRYLSVCSGIEAASMAWEPLGWEPAGFCEIEPFPSAVLAHRWPKVPNHGDMTKYEEWKDRIGAIDLLVGGTPCQSFSVAGLRKGLRDPRGGLMLTFLEIAKCLRPRWVVWENVPGVLSSHGGRDFGSFLGALGELGYGWAYRVLDAQWFGLAQRRKRVFVVGHLGDWSLAGKVLFESESVSRHPAPSRKTGKAASPHVAGCLRSGGDGGIPSSRGENLISSADLAETLMATDHKGVGHNRDRNFVGVTPIHDQATRHSGKRNDKRDGKGNGLGVGNSDDPSFTLTSGDKHGVIYARGSFGSFMESDNAGTLCKRSDEHAGILPVIYENHPSDSRVTGPHKVAPSCVSRFGTGGGNVPLVQEAVAIPIDTQNMTENHASGGKGFGEPGDPSFTLSKSHSHAVAVDTYNQVIQDKAIPIRSTASDICHTGGVIDPKVRVAVRRLTVTECERLQGFPDGHTKIPWRGKPADECPDGPRYKALGNSMAVNCMRWIGERIDKLEKSKDIPKA